MKKLTVGADKEFFTVPDAINAAVDNDVIWIDPGQYNIDVVLNIDKEISFLVNSDDPYDERVVLRWNTGTRCIHIEDISYLLFDNIFFEFYGHNTSYYLFYKDTSLRQFDPHSRIIFNGCSFNKTIYMDRACALLSRFKTGFVEFNHCEFDSATALYFQEMDNTASLNIVKCIGATNWVTNVGEYFETYDIKSVATVDYGPQYALQTTATYDQVLKGEVVRDGDNLLSELFFYRQDTNALFASVKTNSGSKFNISHPGMLGEDLRGISIYPKRMSSYRTYSPSDHSYKIHDSSDNSFSMSPTDPGLLIVDIGRQMTLEKIEMHVVYKDMSTTLFTSVDISHSMDGITYSTPITFYCTPNAEGNWSTSVEHIETLEYPHELQFLKIGMRNLVGISYLYLSQLEIFPQMDNERPPRAMVIDGMRTEEVLRLDARSTSRYRESVLNDLPVAYWRFNEYSVSDSANELVNHYDGTYIGPTIKVNEIGGTESDEDTCVSLIDSDQITVPPFQLSVPLTVEGFVVGENFNESTISPLVYSGTGANVFIDLRVESGQLIFKTSRKNGLGNDRWSLSSPAFLHKIRWMYFALTIDASNLVSLFYNGTKVAFDTCPYPIINANQPLWFGECALTEMLFGVNGGDLNWVSGNSGPEGPHYVICEPDIAGSLNNKYWVVTILRDTSYYLWFDVDGTGVDPAPSFGDYGLEGLQVPIDSDETAIGVASKCAAILVTLDRFIASSTGDTVTVDDTYVYHEGKFDEFVIYSKALSPEALYRHITTAENKIFDYYVETVQDSLPKQYWRLEEEYITNALNSAIPIPDDYIAYFPLQGNVEDSSSNVHDGFLAFGAEFYEDKWGDISGAVFFPNALAYMEVPHEILLNVEPFSVSLWFRTPGQGLENQTLICGSRTGDLHSLLLYLDDNSIPQLIINGVTTTGSGASLDDNLWHNIIITRDDNIPETVIYADGLPIGSSTDLSNILFINNHGLRLGGRPTIDVGDANEVNWNLNGLVDDIRFYDRALTAAEAAEITNDGTEQITGTYNGLITQGDDGCILYSATKCLLFGGFNGRVEIHGMRLKDANTSFTIEFWVNPDSGSLTTLYSEYSSDYDDSRILKIDTRIHLEIYDNLILTESMSSLTKLDTGDWHQVVITYDGTDCKMYVDTRLERTTTLTFQSLVASLAYIGCQDDHGTYNYGFIGRVDEFVYYESELDQATIDLHYTRSNRDVPSFEEFYPATVRASNPIAQFMANDDNYLNERHSSITGILESISRVPSTVSNTDDDALSNVSGNIQILDTGHLMFEGPFTLECWITFKDIDTSIGTDAPQIIDCYERVGDNNSRGYKFGKAMMRSNAIDFTVNDSILVVDNIDQDVQYHLVATYDGSHIHLYKDSILVGSIVSEAPKIPMDPTIFVASSRSGFSLNCEMEQITLYAHSLSIDNIALHYEIGS